MPLCFDGPALDPCSKCTVPVGARLYYSEQLPCLSEGSCTSLHSRATPFQTVQKSCCIVAYLAAKHQHLPALGRQNSPLHCLLLHLAKPIPLHSGHKQVICGLARRSRWREVPTVSSTFASFQINSKHRYRFLKRTMILERGIGFGTYFKTKEN